MRKCPHCAEEIQDQAVKCKHCGGVVVTEEWRAFCQRYVSLKPRQREKEWEALAEDQKGTLRAALAALDYDKPSAAPASRPASKKRTSPLAWGCLVLVVLIGLLSLLGRCAPESGDRARSESSELTSAQQDRAEEALYKAGKAAFERGEYEKAARYLGQIDRTRRDYEDLTTLLAHPEVRRHLSNQRRLETLAKAGSRTGTISIGDEVSLVVDSGKVVVCVDEAAYKRFTQLAVADDVLGVAGLVASGRAFAVESGTRARVIGRGFERREVRILSGEHAGRSGWVTSSITRK